METVNDFVDFNFLEDPVELVGTTILGGFMGGTSIKLVGTTILGGFMGGTSIKLVGTTV